MKIRNEAHYTGVFQIVNEEISGELVHNEEKGVILLNLARPLDEKSAMGKSYGTLKVITGKLNTGAIVTLFNNRVVNNHTQVFSLQHISFISDYLIWSNEEKKNSRFNEIVFVLENAFGWSNMSAYKRTEEGALQEIFEWQEKVLHWYGATISFSIHRKGNLWNASREEETTITQRLCVSIKYEEKKEVKELTSARNKIISLISFAIRSNVNVLEQYLYNDDDTYVIGDSITERRKHFLLDNQSWHEISKTYTWDYNFNLSQIPEDKDISEELSKLEPIFNLYMSLLKYHDMPVEMVFLNLIQALETLHARFFYDDNKNKYIESVEQRFASSVSYDLFRELLLSETQMRMGHIILTSRLNDLFIGDYCPVFDRFWRRSNYAQKLTDTRHYYTHYGKNKEDKALHGDELYEAIFVMKVLLEYHICLILGIDNTSKISREIRNYYDWKSIGEIQSKECSDE